MRKLKVIKQMLDEKKVTLSHILQTIDMLEMNVRHSILKDLQDEALAKQQELEELGNKLVQAEWVGSSDPDKTNSIVHDLVARMDTLDIELLETHTINLHSAVISVNDWKAKTEASINALKDNEYKDINRVAMMQTLFHRGVLYVGSDPIRAKEMFAECGILIEEEKRYQRDRELSIGGIQAEKTRLKSLVKGAEHMNEKFTSVIDKVSDQGGDASLQELREIEIMVKDAVRGLSSPIVPAQSFSRMKTSLEPRLTPEFKERQPKSFSETLKQLNKKVKESQYLPESAKDDWLTEISLLAESLSGENAVEHLNYLSRSIEEDIIYYQESLEENLSHQKDAMLHMLNQSARTPQEKRAISARVNSVMESQAGFVTRQRMLDEIFCDIFPDDITVALISTLTQRSILDD